MDTALWIAQSFLALVFVIAGLWKLTGMAAFIEDLSPVTVRLVGVVECLGAIGVILPAATGILSWLSPMAAVGFCLDMLVAAILHIRDGDYSRVPVNAVLFALAAFVAYGRFVVVPL